MIMRRIKAVYRLNTIPPGKIEVRVLLSIVRRFVQNFRNIQEVRKFYSLSILRNNAQIIFQNLQNLVKRLSYCLQRFL